jgi:hypothetical protein
MDKRIRVLAMLAAVLLTFPLEVRAADAPVPYITGGAARTREKLRAGRRTTTSRSSSPTNPATTGGREGRDRVGPEGAGSTPRWRDRSPAKLPPGTYTIRATSNDQKLTRTVTIRAQGLQQVDLRWDVSK